MARFTRLPALVLGLLLATAATPTTPATARQRTDAQPVAVSVARDLSAHATNLRRLARDAGGDAGAQLDRAADRLDRIAEALRDGRSLATARVRLRQVMDNLDEAADDVPRGRRDDIEAVHDRLEAYVRDLDRERTTGISARDENGRDWDQDPDFWSDASWKDRQVARDRWRAARSRVRAHAPSFVGDLEDSWPYRQTGPYRTQPVFRYNRVDGLVLGVRRLPLDWDSFDRMRVYGQGGYAFSLDRWRYEIGGEARLGRPYRMERSDLKVGLSWRRETASDDVWKVSWLENSMGAFFFRSDLMDYYETEGLSVYGVVRLGGMAQVAATWRNEDHSSLTRHATWSMFGGDAFRSNPAIIDGNMRTLALSVDGGRIRGYRAVPMGAAFRFEAELGSGMGGDFDFNRYIGDVHLYARTGPSAGLALRLRAGTSTGTLPIQKAFTLGGIGSIRAYPQNVFIGSRMLLANFEYTLYGQDLFDELFEDLSIYGLFDAGWTDGPAERAFSTDDVVTAAGLGVGFGDRAVRLELAFPLKDMGTGMEPTLWLRLSPTL